MFAASPIDMMLWQIRVHEHVLSPDIRDEATAVRYRHKFQTEVEPQLIQRLSQHSFICGDDFTAADIVMGHCVMWAKLYGMCKDQSFSGYLSKLSKRPTFLQAYADAGKFDPVPPKDSRTPKLFTG